MKFGFQYRITYENGKTYDRKDEVIVEITKEKYIKIIQGVLQGIPINQIEGIADVIEKMTENVLFID